MGKKYEKCYCSFCKNERKVYTKRRLNVLDVGLIFVLSTLLTLVFWQSLDPRGLIFVTLFYGLGEILVHFRWRLGLTCNHCGFDPILYAKKPEVACEQVQAFMAKQKNLPLFSLYGDPYGRLASKKIKKDEIKNTTVKTTQVTSEISLKAKANVQSNISR